MVIKDKKIKAATLAIFLLASLSLTAIFILSRSVLPWWLFIIPLFMLLMPLKSSFASDKPEARVEPPSEQLITVLPKIVILITGPWAARWFDKQPATLGSRFDHQITWLLTPSATDIAYRLEKLHETGQPLEVSLYFPFLPDGFDNESIIISQLTAWKNSLFCLNVAEKLPCILAIYARLSHERKSHNPDYVFWSGNIDLSQRTEMRVTDAIETMMHDAQLSHNGEPCHVEQRNAMMTLLFSWMNETKIIASLQTFFDATGPLKLSRILVADHGYGFSRHGAWSNWICDKYGLLPGLSSSVSRPPLPGLLLPAKRQQEPKTIVPLTTASKAANPWFIGSYAAAIFLAFLLLFSVWRQSERISKARENLYQFENLNVAAMAEKTARMTAIKQDKTHLVACVENSLLNLILFTRSTCEKLLTDTENEIAKFYAVPLYQSISLFARGSAVLTPDSEKTLTELIPLIRKNPEVRFLITGHSDNTGTPELNQQLSLDRAIAVRDWLIKETHSSENQFITKGAADARPVATNFTEDGRKLNRRVEIRPLP
ncbi:OmpA family protein [Pantoea osteomyelitidis]|uniref:OmpA family protein n=1 Tax=Pantoea osteomyelitidis TaxID=3230026 RepID=A0ABW7Q0V0_9GAMM